ADRNRSHWSTSKTPSYTKSVSWQHHPRHKEYKNGRGKGKGKEKNLKASRMLTLFVNVQLFAKHHHG
ncbi:hypothetical protein P2O56_03985, partial [Escherichia coli]|uniref:hypothetical protein n=1 Tax=Escherichia coli TaxID=562 RepID=UPI001BFD1ABB